VVEEMGVEMFCQKKLIDKRKVLLPLVCIRNQEDLSTCYPMTFDADVYQEDSRRVRLMYRRPSRPRMSANS
jgi:hypothetical protein